MTLRHEETDRLPRGEILIEKEFLHKFYPGDKTTPYNAVMRRLVQEMGIDMVTVRFDGDRGEEGLDELGKWVAENTHFVMALVDGLFWKPEDPLSFYEFVLAFSREEDRIRDLIHTKKRRASDLIQKCLDEGADGIIIGDDLAYDQGPFVSPDDLGKWIFPGLEELVNTIKKEKKAAILHSCGDLTTIIDQIISAGFDGLHGLSTSSGNDPLAIYQITRKRLTLMGIFDLDSLKPREIKALKKQLLPSLSADGGYILGSAAGLSTNTPIDSFRALYS